MPDQRDRSAPPVPPDPMARNRPVEGHSRIGAWVISGIILLAVGGGVYLWKQHQTQTTQMAGPAGRRGAGMAQPVGFATIDTGDIRIVLNELGTVASLDTVTVQTRIDGQLQAVGFKEGQFVRKGDFLAQIDPRPYQAALEQAQGTLARDQGLLAQARSDLRRYQTLGRQDSIAQQQLDDQRYLVEQYAGTVKTDQGAVDTAKLNLSYCRIVSPIDGQVGLRQIDPGNYVQTSSTTGLVVITEMQPISVVFSVPEDNLPDILQRMHAGATLPVQAYDRSNTRLLATGHLETVDNVIDTATGTVKLRAIFTNPEELLYPNQFVNARLLVNTLHNAVRVPVPAVQQGEPGTYVYVINPNDTVSVRPIKVGPIDGNYQAVLSGLKPGERVVTDGTDRLRDGAKVTLPEAGKNGTAGKNGGAAKIGAPATSGAATNGGAGTKPVGQAGAEQPQQPAAQPRQPAAGR